MIESIFERIGGAAAVGAVVNRLYDRLVRDDATVSFFKNQDMAELKKHQRAFLTVALGGPEAYYGSDLESAHANLRISDDVFDIVARHLTEVLHELDVKRADIAAIDELIDSLRSKIVSSEAVMN